MTTDTDRLIHAYIEGDLTPEQAAELSAWVEQSDTNAEHFVRCCVQHYLLREQAVGKDLAESAFSAAGKQTEDADDAESLTSAGLLQQLSDSGTQGQASDELPLIHIDSSTPLTKKAYSSALSYVIKHTFTPKRVAILATAAALLLGMVPTIVFLADGPDEPERVVELPGPIDQPEPWEDPSDVQQIVATLTAEHSAVWERRPGEDLYAGQQLSLLEGFAEVTTEREAVVLIEAPATIELLNSNTIHLHDGKLMGTCETEASKGFVVHTPHMDVTDLGTEFGVFVDSAAYTIAEVFSGSIEVAASGGLSPPKTISPGEWIALDRLGKEIPDHSLVSQVFGDLVTFRAGIVEMSDSLRIANDRPGLLTPEMFLSNTQATIFPELDGAILHGDVKVSIHKPGLYEEFIPEQLTAGSIASGTEIRSYVIRSRGVSGVTVIKGSVTFDAPILGVITQSEDWERFAAQQPGQLIALSEMPPALLEKGSERNKNDISGDWVLLSEDRRTLDFRFHVLASGDDHMRVLVSMPSEEAAGYISN